MSMSGGSSKFKKSATMSNLHKTNSSVYKIPTAVKQLIFEDKDFDNLGEDVHELKMMQPKFS